LNNNLFSTEDINLASFLVAKNIILVEIRPLDKFHCSFVFEKPPKDLLDYWLTGGAFERKLISTYRHLVRDAREIQGRFGGER
jgi:hypothetical protein